MRTVALLLASLLLLAGCPGSPPAEPQNQEPPQMDAIAATIQDKLADRSDVVEARVVYQNNVTAVGSVAVNVRTKAGADFAPIIDEAVKLAWQSRLDPLHTIRVGVIDEVDLQRGETRTLLANGKDQADLERSYGPRPK